MFHHQSLLFTQLCHHQAMGHSYFLLLLPQDFWLHLICQVILIIEQKVLLVLTKLKYKNQANFMGRVHYNTTSSTELTVSTDAHAMNVSTSQTSTSSGPSFTTPPVKKQRLSEADTPTTSH